MEFINIPLEERDSTFNKILEMPLEDRSDILVRAFGRLEHTTAFFVIRDVVEVYPNF